MMEDIREILKKIWPEWSIADKIGEGSFASVYKAVRQDLIGTSYAAIKVIQIPRNSNEIDALRAEGLDEDGTYAYYQGLVKDYSAEIRLMDSVKGYTNIVSIDDYRIYQPEGKTLWYIFIRMELLTPLVKHIALEGADEEKIIRLGIDLCTALDVCSQHHIVHRDIKPENIFINSNGDFKLGDFGVARNLEKITHGLSFKGTPNYMAPEVVKATLKETDFSSAAKVDIYSLGMVMYWLGNCSKLPFLPQKQIATPEDRNNAFYRRMGGEKLPSPQQISPELQRIVLKACSYNPDDRYSSAAEMKADLLRLRDGGVIHDPPLWKNRVKRLIIVLAVLLASGLIVYSLLHSPDEVREETTPSAQTVTESVSPDPVPTDTESISAVPQAEHETDTPASTAPPTPTPVPSPTPTEAPTDTPEPSPTPTEVPTDTPTPTPAVSSVYGDMNNDGVMNLQDLIRLQKYLADNETPINESNADMNDDGVIDLLDLIFLQKKLIN